jgi:arylsulfatase A-like enzyme
MIKDKVWLLATGLVITIVTPVAAQSAPNILLIIADDMGVETLASYGLGENPAATPVLDEMASEGMLFSNFWSQPVCSPTRATVMTGRYGFRTGVGRPVSGTSGPLPDAPEVPAWAIPLAGGAGMGAGMGMGGVDDDLQGLPRHGLRVEEYTLPMAFRENAQLGYATAAIGKWHLADSTNGWLNHPSRVGFDHFAGGITGSVESYFAWNKVVDGEVAGAVGYAPTDKVDDAVAWIADQGENPWFLWFAFNLPHVPLHIPPDDARTGNSDSNFLAMMEAMDAQIGRMLDSLEPDVRDNTYVIFMGDNGTGNGSVTAPFQSGRAKGSVYQGGVSVPFIVTGPGVQRGAVSETLVNSSDLFVTIMEMAGIDPTQTIPTAVTHDSASFLATLSNPTASPREWIYVDEFFGGFAGVETADYAMRNAQYKLLRFNGVEEFYDLAADPYEHDSLLAGELSTEQRAEYLALQEEISRLRGRR